MKCFRSPVMFGFMAFFLYFVSNVCESLDCALNGSGSNKVAYTITVDINGKGNFTKVQDAVEAIPAKNNQWIRILINPGRYVEQVNIPVDKPCVYLEGGKYPNTIITESCSQQTDTSATFTANSDNIVAKGVVFENSYLIRDGLGEKAKPALAARLYGDKYVFLDCSFIGLQDTLWDVSKRHYFKRCYIEGSVDFIFGNGQSIYEECELNVNLRKYDPKRPVGTITAQGRDSPDAPDGFVFKRCVVTGAGKALLGRAYGAYSRVIFYQSKLGDVVAPWGWDAWNFKGKEVNLVYVEKGCTGPGANQKNRVPWLKSLTDRELSRFVDIKYIDSEGWISKLPPGVMA